MIRLTVTLPAPVDELRVFVEACERLGLVDVATDLDTLTMVATLGQAAPVAPPVEAIAKALPHAAKVAKAKKAKPLAKQPSGPDCRTALLAHMENIGVFYGGAAALAREIGHGEQATTKVVQRLASEGILIVDKASKTSTRSISLATKANHAPATVTALPQPAPQRHPATPAPLPAGGIQAPAGGWA